MKQRHLVASGQYGYTLLEVLVALSIGVFLLGGLFTILQNTRRTSSNQTGLAQLQDEERMAMSLLNDVIQNAGNFDTGTYQSALTAWPTATAIGASGTSLAAGQALTGSDGTTDVIAARYGTNGTDGVINCDGDTGGGAAATFLNTFLITSSTSGGVTTYSLSCSIDGTTANAYPLVNGVVNMQIYYGVSTVAAINNVDTYMTATQVTTATGWLNVTSVRVTLAFINPYTGSTPYVYFTRVIPIQSRTGVIATAL
jgi:type IV pilus assembly protein PilW